MKRESESGVFEIKFPVPPDRIPSVLGWMRESLHPDPHGTGEFGDGYLVQSIYLDTPNFDVFHKRGSYGRAKFRIRRYGTNPAVFLERKLKRTGVVRKRRVPVEAGDLGSLNTEANGKVWAGAWFHHRLALRGLRPVVRMSYGRVARFGDGPEGRFRVTLDRDLRAERLECVQAPEPFEAKDLLEGAALLEVKFKSSLPAQVKEMLERTGLSAGPFSKYRLGIKACGWVVETDGAAESEAQSQPPGIADLVTGPLASGGAA
ncbi:MAG: polyphosphate polymerase domain-containing protein [Verrucomicrobiales bacterium]|nr:polyphosphate polymerase domain-containing protein [Verrucomicrobiales bacterium]